MVKIGTDYVMDRSLWFWVLMQYGYQSIVLIF